ncbi:MAG: hypothetical protein LVQ96_04350 [Thermoplasmatales archaeon]|nr:hypothetical protein [Thermoplasmatales archaeon]MCW6170385.1 hypothetical protein [Thermoplasmatales archaeon]
MLSEFFKDKHGLFYISEDIYYKLQVDDFGKNLADFLQDKFLQNTTLNEWESLLQYLPRTIDPSKNLSANANGKAKSITPRYCRI